MTPWHRCQRSGAESRDTARVTVAQYRAETTRQYFVLSSVILRMANCASVCANHAMALVIQKVGSFTATASTMMAYNVVVSVGVPNEEEVC